MELVWLDTHGVASAADLREFRKRHAEHLQPKGRDGSDTAPSPPFFVQVVGV